MKLIIKSLSGQQFTVDAEPANTILQIKEKIFECKKHDVALQKLLRKGQVLNDNQTIEELGITEADFLVVMVNQKKAQPPAQQPPAQQPVQQPSVQQPVQQQAPPPIQPPTTQQKPSIPSGSQFVSGPEFEKMIEELISMGFPREECLNAMRAAFNNPERAAEYLINGIPPNLLHHSRPQQPQNLPPNPPGAQMTGGQQTTPLAPQQPQPPGQQQGGPFTQLRQAYQQNPQAVMGMLPQLLEGLRQSNPALHAQLSQHPEMLIQLLSGLGPQQGASRTIQLTQQEKGDIETLKSFGFTEQDSIEGYLTCDKNVEMAVNYLLERQANGDLFSKNINQQGQHVQRERANPQNQQQPPPPAGGEQGPHDEEDQEDDDDVYQ